MSAKSDEVTSAVNTVLTTAWNVTDARVVPETDDVALSNGAKKVDATYLYADLADSSNLARLGTHSATARVIRTYVNSATRILVHYGGEIRSFDGDRVMAIFIGNRKNNNAVRAAMAINWAVHRVINPALKIKMPDLAKLWTVSHGIGIDTGEGLIVRGGVRNNNDLISIGRAPNLAAKLSEIRDRATILITGEVHSYLDGKQKTSNDGEDRWKSYGNLTVGGGPLGVYGSNWWWSP